MEKTERGVFAQSIIPFIYLLELSFLFAVEDTSSSDFFFASPLHNWLSLISTFLRTGWATLHNLEIGVSMYVCHFFQKTCFISQSHHCSMFPSAGWQGKNHGTLNHSFLLSSTLKSMLARLPSVLDGKLIICCYLLVL